MVADQKFAQAVEAMFEEDFRNSRRMKSGEYENKNYLFRVATRVARLASPVL